MSSQMKMGVLFGGAALALVAAVVLFGRFGKQPQKEPAPKAPTARSATNRAEKGRVMVKQPKLVRDPAKQHAATNKVARVSHRVTNGVAAAAQALPRTPDERKASEMRDLLDSGDERAALKMARELMLSPEANVRSSVVTVIGWIGLKALPELTQMLGDSDEGVAGEALDQWKMAFEEVEDPAAKAELLSEAVQTTKKTEDMEALALLYSQLPESVAIRSLSQVIQSGSAAGDVARSQYEFIAGEAYTTQEAAINLAALKEREEAGL